MRLRDRTGDVVGRLYVLGQGPSITQTNGRKRVQWLCVCECGNETLVEAGNLNSGHTTSCGCLVQDTCARIGSKSEHGKVGTREWSAWQGAKNRVINSNQPSWDRYGGRGISMFAGWLNNFQAFYDYMGPCPEGMTLDRIDNDGDYAPGNVRWATKLEQARNKSNSTFVEFEGERQHLAVFAERLGLPYRLVSERVKRQGWSVYDALTKPLRKGKK